MSYLKARVSSHCSYACKTCFLFSSLSCQSVYPLPRSKSQRLIFPENSYSYRDPLLSLLSPFPPFSSFGGCTAHCCSRRPSRPSRLCSTLLRCIWLAGLELSRRGGRGKTRRPTYQVFLLLREFHATRQRTKRSNSSQLWICRRELVPCR